MIIGLDEISAWHEGEGETIRERLTTIREAKRRAYETLFDAIVNTIPNHIGPDDERKARSIGQHIEALEQVEAYYEQELSGRLFWTPPIECADEID